jgi:rhodanese-related sulfurtransferase
VSSIGREREANARLGGGRSRESFVALMAELKLAYPKNIDRALPANQACGRETEPLDAVSAEAGSFRRLTPEAARPLLPRFRVVDVREPGEFVGPLGHVPGAVLVPLATLTDAAQAWSREAPVLLVCRSGARSTRAAEALVAMGFRHVYELVGGMTAWNESGLPVLERGV